MPGREHFDGPSTFYQITDGERVVGTVQAQFSEPEIEELGKLRRYFVQHFEGQSENDNPVADIYFGIHIPFGQDLGDRNRSIRSL